MLCCFGVVWTPSLRREVAVGREWLHTFTVVHMSSSMQNLPVREKNWRMGLRDASPRKPTSGRKQPFLRGGMQQSPRERHALVGPAISPVKKRQDATTAGPSVPPIPHDGRLFLHGRTESRVAGHTTRASTPEPEVVYKVAVKEYYLLKGHLRALLEKLKWQRDDVRDTIASVIRKSKECKLHSQEKDSSALVEQCEKLLVAMVPVANLLKKHIAYVRKEYHQTVIKIKGVETLNRKLEREQRLGTIVLKEVEASPVEYSDERMDKTMFRSYSSLLLEGYTAGREVIEGFDAGLKDVLDHIKSLRGEFSSLMVANAPRHVPGANQLHLQKAVPLHEEDPDKLISRIALDITLNNTQPVLFAEYGPGSGERKKRKEEQQALEVAKTSVLMRQRRAGKRAASLKPKAFVPSAKRPFEPFARSY